MKLAKITLAALAMAGTAAFAQGTSQSGAATTNPSTVRQAQQALSDKGMNVTADGKWGPKTEAAVRQFQQQQGINATGSLDNQTLSALGVSGSGSASGSNSSSSNSSSNSSSPSSSSSSSSSPSSSSPTSSSSSSSPSGSSSSSYPSGSSSGMSGGTSGSSSGNSSGSSSGNSGSTGRTQ